MHGLGRNIERLLAESLREGLYSIPAQSESGRPLGAARAQQRGGPPSVDGVLGMQLHGGKDLLEPCSVVLSDEVQVVG